MRLIFVTREGFVLPGARVRCYNFSRELARHGIETQVLSFADSLGAKDGENESRMGACEKVKFNYRAFRKLAKDKSAVLCIQRFNYHSFAPYLANIFRGNRLILDLDDWEMRENPKYYFGFYPSSKAHYFTRTIARRSVFCIAASRFLEDFLKDFNSKTYYLPSGVDTEVFKPLPYNSDNGKIVFSWIGTLHKKEYIENIGFVLEGFARLRKQYSHIYFEIAGDGIYRADLLRLLAGLNDPQIRFKGWIAPEAVPQYLANIHIGTLPVARDNKFNLAKSPTKLFEYMAMARPTVSSCIGEPRHIISDGTDGFLAQGKEEFIAKMRELIENPDLCRLIGARARHKAEANYSLKVLGAKLGLILKENLKN
jgi:glycosyltransferase involved in cell wall biosynthesis